MKRVQSILNRLLYPPKWVLALLPGLSFPALIWVFSTGSSTHFLAYVVYVLSAYALTVLVAAAPKLLRWLRAGFPVCAPVQRFRQSRFGGRYWDDLAFRGSVSIYQGMTVNFLYVAFRIVASIRYASVWFLSMAVYYLVLGILRAYLILCYRHRTPALELRCYRRTAGLLFLLNIPMGGMILLMVRTNSSDAYPDTILYLSALYTFYAMALAIRNVVKFRRLGSPILSAAKVLHLISAMMSILGLQSAMISHFSKHGDSYRRMMNAITGSFVYGAVIVLAAAMLLRSRRLRKEAEPIEPLRK